MIAYQTAYLKAHWPSCFMAALLNSDSQNLDRVTIEVEECRRINLEVLPPDINESFGGFSVVKGTNKIRFGLQAIKGLGEDVVEVMVAERKKGGEYKSLEDFVSRIPGKSINKKSLECLIRSGALDRFGDRNALFFNIDAILEYHKRQEQEASSGQFSLFAGPSTSDSSAPAPIALKTAPSVSRRELLAWEKELLGLYVSEHPFKEYGERLGGMITPIAQLAEKKAEKKVRVGGVISSAKKILTKNNEPMMFCKLEDQSGDCEVVVFPRVLRDSPLVWQEDHAVIVSGRPSEKEGRMNVLAETGFEITPQNIDEIHTEAAAAQVASIEGEGVAAPADPNSPITLLVRPKLPETMLIKLRAILDAHPGDHPVYFLIEDVDGPRRIKSSAKIQFTDIVSKELEVLLGRDTVKVGDVVK
jgi:DNA polymerase-3 subunit alpha